ncbi:MAG: zinc ribbon domain-containing protein [Methanomethylophilus sp.]|jgi:hypothetical protein
MKCAECGREYEDWDFCPYCGAYPKPAGQETQSAPNAVPEQQIPGIPGYTGSPYETPPGVTPLSAGQRIGIELLSMTLALLICIIGGSMLSLMVGMVVVLIASFVFQNKPLVRNPVPQMIDGGLWGLMIGLLYEIFTVT